VKWRIKQCLWAAQILGLLALSLAAHGDTQAGQAARITSIRELSAGGSRRIVITLDRNAEIRQACLTRPDRLYFDFHHTRMARPLQMNKRAAKLRKTRRLRLGHPVPDTVRAVLAARGVARVVAYKTGAPARLIIELSPGRRHQSLCRNGAQESLVKLVDAPVVVIDPGHGGADRGVVGSAGSSEADVALAVGKRLAALLRDREAADVVLTRADDRYLSLGQRTAIAKQAKADLFVSLHAAAGPDPADCGPRTYYLALTTSRPVLRMASRENAGYDHTVYELPELIDAIMRDRYAEESHKLEASLADALSSQRHTRNKDAKEAAQAPLALLMGLDSPGVFVSLGCMKSPEEARKLRSQAEERKLARELYAGISDYLREKTRMELQ
jgi:N-acetylmuramoyl-L-alanine amidase